jgi:hypothetical protein
MLRRSKIFGLALLLIAGSTPLCKAQTAQPPQASLRTPASSATAAQKSKSRANKPQPAAEVTQVPPRPPTLEQQPPAAPQVTYKNGQLTIDSRNATLSQVLHSVQAQTGASVEIPPGAGNERVVATLGPGQPKDVLASLLNGSKFNYVILGEANNPGAVQKVILMASVGATTGTSVATTAQNTPLPPQQPQAVEPPEDDYQQTSEPEVENQQTPGPTLPGGENLQPDVINPAGRTPEQMLQELQRMQQQQQQMQQQLNPANQQQAAPPGVPLVARPQPQ